MSYTDNQTKFTCVINARTPLPQALNALGHALIGLTGKAAPGNTDLLDYPFGCGSASSVISRHPLIILQARNANQLRTLAGQAASAGVQVNVFANTMLGRSAREQQAQTAAVALEDADLFAVALLGQSVLVDPLTRRFSLFRDPRGKEAGYEAS